MINNSKIFAIKGMGGRWGPGQNFHFELFERAPLGGTNALHRMSKLIIVQKLSHFEVCNFGRISYKKMEKSQILRYFTPNVSGPSIFA